MQSSRPAVRSWPPLSLFVGYAAAALALAGLFALSWFLREIVILAFGSVVLAAVIRAITQPLVRRFPKREKLAVLLAILGLFVFCGALFWLFGHQVSAQLRDFSDRLPQAVASTKSWLEQHAPGRFVLEQLEGSKKEAGGMSSVMKAAGVTLDSFGHALLMLVAGIYLALTPGLYVAGAVRLLPVAKRETVRTALEAAGEALQRWLLGQVISMTTIGVLTTLGLWIVGCPVPLALGILAGLLVFVPIIGFLVAFIPTVLIALSESTEVALAAVIAFLIVQQLEEQVVQPLAQRWATSLPPALGLFALAAAGVLFGLPGLIFGCPLTVVLICLTKKLYLENGLEKGAGH